MATRKRSGKRVKSKGVIRRFLGYAKLLMLVGALAVVGGGIWYAQQDEATQRRAQAQAVGALDWLDERDETNKVADQFLVWVIDRIPVSRGAVMLAGDTEGADQYTYAGVPISTRPLKILENDAYIVGYDEEMKNPAWVAYKLVDAPDGKTAKRPSGLLLIIGLVQG